MGVYALLQSVCCLGSEAGCCHGNVSLPDASCPCSVCYPMLEKHSFESLKDSASTTAVFVVAMVSILYFKFFVYLTLITLKYFCIILGDQRVFFQFEIIRNVLVSSFRFI